MTRTILIIGQIPDPHIASVVEVLIERGAKVLIFDRLQPQKNCYLNYYMGPDGITGFFCANGERCNLAEVNAVWWRIKPVTMADMTGQPTSLAAGFAWREWQSALEALEFFTPKARWVNPRIASLQARNKPTQLLLAHELGFTIPTTLISNEASSVAKFIKTNEDKHIYKVLTWYFEPPDQMIFTSAVEADQVSSDPGAVSMAPGIFQVRIPKAYEVRATVVGDRVFSVRIDSQAHEQTKLDWRRDQYSLSYSLCDLPRNIRKLLVRMSRRLMLSFGAYDLIVTPSGQYIFLEVNPLGQWLWLENATGVPISRALAELLLE